jgi:dipeptidyl-peptidase-4
VWSFSSQPTPSARWELYDTVYTERYMSTPADNPHGYNASSPLWRLDNLKNKEVTSEDLLLSLD